MTKTLGKLPPSVFGALESPRLPQDVVAGVDIGAVVTKKYK